MMEINEQLIIERGNELRRRAENERLQRTARQQQSQGLRNAIGKRLIQAGERLISER